MREHADRARHLADGHHLARRVSRARPRCNLGVPERELHAERHRFGMYAMRPSNHRCAPMLLGPRPHGLEQQRRDPRESDRTPDASAAQVPCRPRPKTSGRSAATARPARRLLGHGGRERDDVVLGGLLNLLDARDVERRAFAAASARRPRAPHPRPPARRWPPVRPRATPRTGASRVQIAPISVCVYRGIIRYTFSLLGRQRAVAIAGPTTVATAAPSRNRSVPPAARRRRSPRRSTQGFRRA